MENSTLPSQNMNEVAASVGDMTSINKDGGSVGSGNKQKGKDQKGMKSTIRGGDIEMHGLWPNPFLGCGVWLIKD